MPAKTALLQLSRKIHLYLGLFISPALLFFAFTGGYQTLGLHEASSNYKPARLLAELGQIHKKQTSVLPVRRPNGGGADAGRVAGAGSLETGRSVGEGRPADAVRADTSPRGEALRREAGASKAEGAGNATGARLPGAPQVQLTLQAKQKQHLPLKLFFVLVSLGLLTSTVTGIYMAYKYDRNKALVSALLLAGVVLPLVLLRF